MDNDYLPDFCRKPVLIIGCGNILFGDDGFGPAVVRHLCEHYTIPGHVCLIDAGTGVRNILFTLALSEKRPEEIIVIDAVDKGLQPGELFEISIDDIPLEKTDDFSMHQAPTSNLLKEMKERCNVTVRVLACQVTAIPEEMRSGLSGPLERAIPLLSSRISAEYFNRHPGDE